MPVVQVYPDTEQFAMRGRNKVKVSDTEADGGEYQFNEAFNAGPPKFKSYAIKLWEDHIWQSWED